MFKLCPSCGLTQPHTGFNSDPSRAHGISTYCKSCSSQKSMRRHTDDPIKHRANVARWRQENAERAKATSDAWHARNRDHKLRSATAWYFANREHAISARSARRLQNLDVEREKMRAYCRENQHVFNAKNGRRRAIAAIALRPYDIDLYGLVDVEAYTLARQRSLSTGIPWRVDHVIPLVPPRRSSLHSVVCRKNFCGPTFPAVQALHNEFNFAVITAAENSRKSNRRWPDMP